MTINLTKMSDEEEQDEESTCDDEESGLRGSVLSRYISRFRYGEPLSRKQRDTQKSREREFWWLDSHKEAASPRQPDSSSDDYNFGQYVGLAQESSVPQYQKRLKQDRLNQKTLQNRAKKSLHVKPPKYSVLSNSATVRSYTEQSARNSPGHGEFQCGQLETPETPFQEYSSKLSVDGGGGGGDGGGDLLEEWRRKKKKKNCLKDSPDDNLVPPNGMTLDNEIQTSPTLSVEISHDSSCDPIISSEGLGSSPAGGSSSEDLSFKPNFIQFLSSTKKDSDLDKYNCGLPFSQYWKENLDNDLLYQWRVKRRIQMAREQAQYKQGYQGSRPSSQARLQGFGRFHTGGAGTVNLVEEPLESHENEAVRSIQSSSGNLHTNLVQYPAPILVQAQEEVNRHLQEVNSQSKVNVEVQTYPDLNRPKVTTVHTIPIASPHLKQCNSCSKTVPAHIHMECDILPCQHCTRKNTGSVGASDPNKPVTLEPTEYRKYLVAEKPHHCPKPAVNPPVDQRQRQDTGKEKTSKTDQKRGTCNGKPPHGPGVRLTSTSHGSGVGVTGTPHGSGVGFTGTPQLTNTSEGRLCKPSANKEKEYSTEDRNIDSTDRNKRNMFLAPQQSSLDPQTKTDIKYRLQTVPSAPVPGSIPSEDVCETIPDLFDDMYNSDGTDFPSDPLLQYLRKLRSQYQERMRYVDRKLKNLQPHETVQLEDPCTRNI